MANPIQTHCFPNGLTLLAERMPHVRSAAFTFLIPSGAVYDPPEFRGTANVLIDLITRGAGSRDNRELSEAMDGLGLDHSESNGLINHTYSGALLARDLEAALELYADILRRPHFPEDELEPAQSLAIQDIHSLEDDPQDKVMVELRKNYYPHPLNLDRRGSETGISTLSIQQVQEFHAKHYQPQDVILAVAGDIQFDRLRDQIERLFGDWKASPRTSLNISAGEPKSLHLTKELEETQIAIAFPSVRVQDPDYYLARGAVGVLSNDMSARLFSNVREKYGLCYAIYASFEAFRDRGTIIGYTGGEPQNAKRLFELFLNEFRILKDGIDTEELDRVKIGLKSSLIMRQESTGSRVSSMASDWYFLNRVRPLEEIQKQIDSLNAEAILDYLSRYPLEKPTVVTIGAEPVN
jgi:predicted Zn-dependent peptidase